MRNLARCGTVHDRPESAFTISGIRTLIRSAQEYGDLFAHAAAQDVTMQGQQP
jgi:hypothetical protein